MKRLKTIGLLLVTLSIGNYSYCQRWVDSQHVISPKVKAKIDSLYPDAWRDYSSTINKAEPTRKVVVALADSKHYGCTQINITCDTNGNIITTDFHGLPLSYLPDTIQKVITTHVEYKAMGIERKTINSKGEVSYDVRLALAGQSFDDLTYYVWSFKSSGELVSKDKRHSIRIE
jgi:hypothetical protein